ncbi:MAG: hypothetical protein EZS28_051532, partial [Streblomastix strix]
MTCVRNPKPLLKDIYEIFANCKQSHRVFAVNVDFDTFHSNYPVLCTKQSEEEAKIRNIHQIPNEIIPGLFLGGYLDCEVMLPILQELRITHILNCAKEFTTGVYGDDPEPYNVPEGVIVKQFDIFDESEQIINFAESFQFIDSALKRREKEKQILDQMNMRSKEREILKEKELKQQQVLIQQQEKQ